MADWGSALQGFSQGLQGGMNMGLLAQEQRLKEQAIKRQEDLAARQAAQAEAENDLKMADYQVKIFTNKNMPKEMKKAAFNSFAQIAKKRGFGDLTGVESWEDGYDQFASKAKGLWNDFMDPKKGMDLKTAMNAFTGLAGEARDEEERTAIKPYQERLSGIYKEQEDERKANAPKILGNPEQGIARVMPSTGEVETIASPMQKPVTDYQQEMIALRKETIAASERQHKERMAELKNAREGAAFDKVLVTKTITELPKMKKEAISGNNSISQIDRALELIDKGVTGKGGQLKAFIAPYAEMLGVPSENLNDAQAYALFTRAIVGPMRLDLIGPGPVSEWEQKIMQQLSGAGGASKAAAKELLSYYKTLAKNKVSNYNDTIEGITKIAPNISEVFKPIAANEGRKQQETKAAKTVVKRFLNKRTGQVKTVYSDGSEEIK